MKKLNIIASASFFLGMLSSPVHALIPSFDIGSIVPQLGVIIQNVTQSSVIVEAGKTASGVAQTYGNAKSSISGFMGDRVERLKKRMEEVQEEIEYAKEKAEEFKEYQEYAEQLQAELNELQKYYDEGMAAYEEAKNSKGLEGKISGLGKMAAAGTAMKDTAGSALGTASTGTGALQQSLADLPRKKETTTKTTTPEQVVSSETTVSTNITNPVETGETRTSGTFPVKTVGAISNFLSKAEQAVNKTGKEETPEAAETPDEVPDQVLNNPEAIDNLVAKTPSSGDKTSAANSVESVKDVLVNTNSASEGAVATGLAAKPALATPTLAPTEGFRQRPNLVPATLEQRSDYRFSETLAFAASLTIPDSPAPVGGTYRNTFIFSDELAKYCKINANDLSNKEKTKECQVKLVSCMFHKNNNIAQDCKKLYAEILHETTLAQTAESLDKRQTAAAYSKQVIEVIVDDMVNATTIRDDINNLATMNKEIITLLSYMVELAAGEIAADSLAQLGSFDRRVVADADADAAADADLNGQAEGSGI